LSVLGPADLFSGGSAQFQMIAVLGGTHVDITPQAVWSTSEAAVLTVSPSGVAAAHAPGTVTVSATYQNRTVARMVVVMPEGTFRLSGSVLKQDAISPAMGVLATVEVIAGIGTGLKVIAMEDPDFGPMYTLRGVAGPVTIVASAAGHVTQMIEIDVQRHTTLDIVMVPFLAPSSASPAGADGAANRRR
jgi:hypothetical protein